jgi:hypothetical protein
MPIRTRIIAATIVGNVVMLSGCPGEEPAPSALQGTAGSDAVAAAIAKAQSMEQLQPPPGLDTLCALRFESTSFDDAKKLFGEPKDESMDKSKAGLSYRYQNAVSLVLTFDWHDGNPGWGTVLTGIGGGSLKSGYLLSEASLNGLPYPDCWPHEEP